MKITRWEGVEMQISTLNNPDIILPESVSLVLPQQTHTAHVDICTSPGQTFPDTDALITRDPAIAVGVRTADCQPILLYAPDIRAVAAIHAGWRGTFGRIGSNTVRRLTALGANPAGIKALLGPSICPECYEVSAELVKQFREAGFRHLSSPDHLDLARLNAEDLADAGIQPANITFSHQCTRHTTDNTSPTTSRYLYPSWRREPGTTTRLISAIRLT